MPGRGVPNACNPDIHPPNDFIKINGVNDLPVNSFTFSEATQAQHNACWTAQFSFLMQTMIWSKLDYVMGQD